uniref:Pre-C2HC domain-containing protein n=1 Tax=Heliothis virescens TaxID=7102 RepID=A0A2A4J3A5_HELVI
MSDLVSQGVPVTHVHRMHRARGGPAYDMVLVVSEPTVGKHHPIFSIRSVCNLSGISIEKPVRSGIVTQCHRCQLWGHSQSNCFAQPRCVKCTGDHGTADCPRPKDRTLCTEPPSCVLCGNSGHHRGCPKAPKASPKLAKRASARQQRESPSAIRPPIAQLPERLSPQRPCPWNALNHQCLPRTKANPDPGPDGSPHPAPPWVPPRPQIRAPCGPSQRSESSPTGPRPPKASPSGEPSTATFDPVNVILSTFSVLMSDRAQQHSKAIIDSQGDLIRLWSVIQEFSDVAQSIKNLPHFKK